MAEGVSGRASDVRVPLRERHSSAKFRMLGSHLWLVGAALLGLPVGRSQSYYDPCYGDDDVRFEAPITIRSGESTTREIQANHTHRFDFHNYNLTTMGLPDNERKVIISLEPCYGVVFLFVRKNIACHPNPYSCINLRTGYRDSWRCERTHFMSEINGSKDGAPTFFQVSLSASSYYISVFATQESRYALTVLDDVGAWPRRGNNGIIRGAVMGTGEVMLQWTIANYFPLGISETKRYYVYAIRLLEDDEVNQSSAVLLRPEKILNTVCGILNNTDHEDDIVDSDLCDTTCNTSLLGLLSGSRYVFNVVVESHRGFKMAYAGVSMLTTWQSVDNAVDGGVGGGRRLMEVASETPMDPKDIQVVGAVMGSVLGMVGVAGMILLRFTS